MPKEFPLIDDILQDIDFDRVANIISSVKNLKDYNFREAKELVVLAAETWLPRDLMEFELEADSFEQKYEEDGKKGYIDLRGKLKGYCTGFSKYKGHDFSLDWKTLSKNPDTDWKNRLVDSFQWRMYDLFKPASIFIYRGVSRNGTTREVPIVVPENAKTEAAVQIYGCTSQIQSYIDTGLNVWPKNMPFACHAYARECPRYNECSTYTMPLQAIKELPTVSYSLTKQLLLCPERARRDILDKQAEVARDDETDESLLGQAFHLGVAELWRQAFNLPEKEEEIDNAIKEQEADE